MNASFLQSYDVMTSFVRDDDEENELTNRSMDTITIEEEIRAYMEMKTMAVSVDVNMWWKENRALLPILSKGAQLVMGIPANSAAAERIFFQCRQHHYR